MKDYQKPMLGCVLAPFIPLIFLPTAPEMWWAVVGVFLIGFICAGIIYLIETW